MNEIQTLDYWNLTKNTILVGTLVVFISFILTIVPCTLNIDKEPSFSLCTIKNPFVKSINLDIQYYWSSTNPLLPIIYQFLIGAIIFLIITLLIKKNKTKIKKSKIIDLTKK